MILNEKVYEILKWICLIVLPALATFIYALATIWNIPHATQVCETITAIATLIGCVIGVSHVNYYEKKEQELNEAKTINGQEGGHE